MKNYIAILIIHSLLLVVIVVSADAVVSDLYMTSTDGETTSTTSFTLNDTPYVHFVVSRPPATSPYTVDVLWGSPSGANYTGDSMVIVSGTLFPPGSSYADLWSTYLEWTQVATPGLWDVTLTVTPYLGYPGSGGIPGSPTYQAASFTVTPEPISSILFIIGGATLSFRQFRKRRLS